MSRLASVQTAQLGLEAIEEDLVRLPGGQYRAVLEVGSVDFALKGEVEQEALIVGYAGFLNSLTYPVQILVRVLPIDIEGYLGDLERRARQDLPDDLAALAHDHVAFVRRLARRRTLLERRFYLVVPAESNGRIARRAWGWPFARRRDGAVDASAARRRLTFRCQEIAGQLDRCGLKVRRLASAEFAQLYFTCWCPDLARVQRLQRDLADYTALVVQAGQSEPRHEPRPKSRRV